MPPTVQETAASIVLHMHCESHFTPSLFCYETGDLRFLLCGNATECDHIRASEWTLTDFLQRYFRAPEDLAPPGRVDADVRSQTRTLEEVLDDRVASPPKTKLPGLAEYERRMWEEEGWVVCEGGKCSRTISREAWLADRGGTCSAEIVAHLAENPGSLAVEMDLCNLNSQMDQLCQRILEKVVEWAGANCIAAGNEACLAKSFFYSPATFSSSNQEFTRDTVRNFYRRFRAGADGTPASLAEVCPAADAKAAGLLAQNNQIRARCGAVPIETLKDALEAARAYIDLLMRILFDLMNIVMDFMQLAGVFTEESRQRVTQDLLFWFQQLIVDMGESLKSLGTIVFKMVFEESALGASLRDAIKVICEIVTWLLNNVWRGFFCPILQALLPIILNAFLGVLSFFSEVIGIINDAACWMGICIPDANPISFMITTVTDFKNTIEGGGLNCQKTFDNPCFQDTGAAGIESALPVATRCWAG
jgi:hypothetical protein